MSSSTTPLAQTGPDLSAADPLLAGVGSRLGRARRERGLTLAVAAGRSGLSPAYLSQIESGTANPTVRALALIAAAVGVEVPALFGAGVPSGASFEPQVSPAALAQSTVGSPGIWDHTAPGSTRLAARIVHGDAADHAAPCTHDGEEYVLVLRGTCTLHVDDTVLPLAPGDACHFPAGRVHRLDDVSPDLTLSVVMGLA